MEVKPNEELFFKRENSTTLTISNTSADTLSFKVKTTSPKVFNVRPNTGILGPKETIAIQITISKGSVLDPKRKDKFLVQGIKLPSDIVSQPLKVQEYWAQTEQAKKLDPSNDLIVEKKLRCVYQENPTLEVSRNQEPHRPSNPGDRVSVYNFDEEQTVPTGNSNSSDLAKELEEKTKKVAVLEATCEGYKQEIERLQSLRQRRGDSGMASNTVSPSIANQVIRPLGYTTLHIIVCFIIGLVLGMLFF